MMEETKFTCHLNAKGSKHFLNCPKRKKNSEKQKLIRFVDGPNSSWTLSSVLLPNYFYRAFQCCHKGFLKLRKPRLLPLWNLFLSNFLSLFALFSLSIRNFWRFIGAFWWIWKMPCLLATLRTYIIYSSNTKRGKSSSIGAVSIPWYCGASWQGLPSGPVFSIFMNCSSDQSSLPPNLALNSLFWSGYNRTEYFHQILIPSILLLSALLFFSFIGWMAWKLRTRTRFWYTVPKIKSCTYYSRQV